MHPSSVASVALIVILAACKSQDTATAAGPTPVPGSRPPKVAEPAEKSVGIAALSGFEGELGLLAKSAKSEGPPKSFSVLVKGTKLRFDMPETPSAGPQFGSNVHIVLSTGEKRLFAVMDEKKQVVIVNLDTLADRFKKFRPPGASGQPANEAPPKLTKTGHTDHVAGHACEDWEILTAKGEKAVVCVASEGASWFELPSIGLPTEHAWARELLDGHHLPLRMIGYDDKGEESARLELTKLEKKAVADAAFEIPVGYKTLDVGEMLKGFMGAGMSTAAGMPPGAPAGAPLSPELQEKLSHMPANVRDMMQRMPPNVREMMMKRMQEHAKSAK